MTTPVRDHQGVKLYSHAWTLTYVYTRKRQTESEFDRFGMIIMPRGENGRGLEKVGVVTKIFPFALGTMVRTPI